MSETPPQPPGSGSPGGASRGELERMWREHRRWVAAVLVAHAHVGQDIEDLLQDVAVAFVTKHHQLRDPTRVRPWLRAIAVNAVAATARRDVTRRRHEHSFPGEQGPDDAADPRDEVRREARERAGRVLELAARLHDDYREPLLLRCVDGLSQRQIAEALGLPETTVETRLARARRMLRAEVERDDSSTVEPLP